MLEFKDKMKKKGIPEKILQITKFLTDAGFEAYLVGGCVRDFLLGRTPKDWDITTNANPEEIQRVFPDSVYENNFGTVGVKIRKQKEGKLEEIEDLVEIIEVTPYRLESKYTDKRHPDDVCFTRNIKDDLKRRDFTINTLALQPDSGQAIKPSTGEIIDLFNGQKDLKNKIIRAVGDPMERFNEDALRVLRAIRFSVELGFIIEEKTKDAIKQNAHLLKMIAKERIKDEFVKIIMSDRPKDGIEIANELGVLKYILPELEEGIGVEQGKSHKFPVWEHNLNALEFAASKRWSLEIRLAALFHDIGKPVSRRASKDKNGYTFYGHEVVGYKMSIKILSHLNFSKKIIEMVAKFVRYHMFFSDTEQITLSAVRRAVRNVGKDNIWDLMKVRMCDRVGMGRLNEEPYRLRKYESMIDEALRAPLSVTALKINGTRLIEMLHVQPGPKIGNILHLLFEEVMDAPEKNTAEWLENRAKEFNVLSDTELSALGKKAKEIKEKAEDAEIKEIRKKWWVK